MTLLNPDIQQQLDFQRQSRRLSRTIQKPINQQITHTEEDIKLHKQLLKKALTEQDVPAIQQHGDKLIEFLAKKTSLHIYELYQKYKHPPETLIKQLAQQYTKEATKIKIIIEHSTSEYGNTKR